jgi:hypothetical protein
MAGPPELPPGAEPATRPYGSPDALGGNSPRTAQFSTGAAGDPQNTASVSSLPADSAAYNALVPRQFSQHSVLQTAMPSANGMSAQDYQRVLPGGYTLPTQNGSSSDTYEKATYMRLSGQDEI